MTDKKTSSEEQQGTESSTVEIGRSDVVTDTEGLFPVEVGDEVWVAVSPVRGNAFRAVRVELKERVSVGGYEEKHAIEDWEGDIERLFGHE